MGRVAKGALIAAQAEVVGAKECQGATLELKSGESR